MVVKNEVFGFTFKTVPFAGFPGWLQLAIGLLILSGVVLLCVVVFVFAPRQLNGEGSAAAIDKMMEIGALMVLLGAISIFIAALILPHL